MKRFLPVGDDATWKAKAICQGVDRDLFFSLLPEDIERAKEICRHCPVREQCLDWALANGEFDHGVWGGLSPDERRQERRRRRVIEAAKRSSGAADTAR